MTPAMPPTPHPDHDRGLEFDVRTLVARRSALGLLGGAGLAALAACTDGTSGPAPGPSATRPAASGEPERRRAARHPARSPSTPRCPPRRPARSPVTAATARTCSTTPASSARDLRSSVGTSTTTATGVPLTVNLTVLDSASGLPRDAGGRRVRVALRRAGPLLDVLARRRGRELPARGAADRRQRHGDLHHGLPRLLPGALAAHPLRGLPQHRGGDQRRADRAHQPARAARGGLARRSTATPPPTRAARTAWRARRWPRTWCSATTAASTSSRP